MGFADMAGGVVGSIANVASTILTNDANNQQAKNQMNFQSEMSSTAHQREVKDLIAAGLNPNLSLSGGGASTPSGASATMQAPQINIPDMWSAAISMRQLDQADRKLDIEDKATTADIMKKVSEKDLNVIKQDLSKKGMPRAILEGEAADLLKQAIRAMKQKFTPKQEPLEKKRQVQPPFTEQGMP